MFRTINNSSALQPKLLLFVEQFDSFSWSFAFSVLIYFSISIMVDVPWKASGNPYFNFLADAFLHGQLNLRIIPPETHDLVYYNGNYYLYWPPFPAIVFLPLVFLFSVHVSDVLITIILGALNVGLVSALLRSGNQVGLFTLSKFQRGLLVIFFAFGTVHMTLAPLGRVWYTSQIIGFLCLVIAYLIALNCDGWRAFALAGIAMGCALATRNHLIFAGIWPAWYLIRKHSTAKFSKMATFLLIGIAPILFVVILLMSYNNARFLNPFDVGVAYHKMAYFFLQEYAQYGCFDIHYIPVNFYYQYVNYPFPARWDSFKGGSMFLLSPVFIAAFFGFWKGRRNLSTWLLVLTILVVDIPILMLMGTGWAQFGPRYSLDFTIPLLLLTAMGIEYWQVQRLSLLVLISLAHYVPGALLLGGL